MRIPIFLCLLAYWVSACQSDTQSLLEKENSHGLNIPFYETSVREIRIKDDMGDFVKDEKEYYTKVITKIHESLLDGSIQAYKTEDFETALSTEEVELAGAQEDLVRIYPEPDDPYYYIDSVIMEPVELTTMPLLMVKEQWNYDANTNIRLSKALAIAPAYFPKVEGITLAKAPLYWIKMDDLEKVLDAHDYHWIHHFVYKSLQDELSEKSYR